MQITAADGVCRFDDDATYNWGRAIYPHLDRPFLVKLTNMLFEFYNSKRIQYDQAVFRGEYTTIGWSYPFVFDHSLSDRFVEYDEYVEIAEQILLLESAGRLTIHDLEC